MYLAETVAILIARVLSASVADRLVPIAPGRQTGVDVVLVRVDTGALGHGGLDDRLDRLLLHVGQHAHHHFPPALRQPQEQRLVLRQRAASRRSRQPAAASEPPPWPPPRVGPCARPRCRPRRSPPRPPAARARSWQPGRGAVAPSWPAHLIRRGPAPGRSAGSRGSGPSNTGSFSRSTSLSSESRSRQQSAP